MGSWKVGRRFTSLSKKLVSEDAHFWLSGYVNNQNCRFWSEDQPEALQKLPIHSEKVTVWCGLKVNGIIRQRFFKDSVNSNKTVNDEHYREIISNFFLPKMQELDLHDKWFQLEAATCHTLRVSVVERRVR